MGKTRVIAGIAVSLCLAGFSASAQASVQNVTARSCGSYRYDIVRVVDGFLIKVADGSRVRSLFYRDVFFEGFRHEASILSGCQGDALAIADTSSGRYNTDVTMALLDPTQAELRLWDVGTRGSVTYATSTATVPPEATALMDQLLSIPRDEWSVTRTELVAKQRIPAEKNDVLNDRSYYVFDGTGRGVVRKLSPSFWNTTVAEDSLVCPNGNAYVLYAKQFAEKNTATSTSPAMQYIIERSGNGRRTLIPIPYVDGSWRTPSGSLSRDPYFGRCLGEGVSVFVQRNIFMVLDSSSFVRYRDPAKALPPPSFNTYVDSAYYNSGMIRRRQGGIDGTATIKILNADGTVTEKRPVFFQDLLQYPVGTTMEFRRDPRDQSKVIVALTEYVSDPSIFRTVKYFLEAGGVYREVMRDESEWQRAEYRARTMTPLYVSAEKDMLTVRSYFLSKRMLLHGLPNKKYTLRWSRVGPLERDGSRKIWYGFAVDGRTETWLAKVR